MLKKFAPYSLETILSSGIGGFFERLRGFNRLYHGFFLAGSAVKGVGATEEAVVVVVRVLSISLLPYFAFSFSFSGSEEEKSLSDPTYLNGSVAMGSLLLVV